MKNKYLDYRNLATFFEKDDAGAAVFGTNASTIEEAGIQFKQNAPSTPDYAAKVILKNIKKILQKLKID